MLIIGWMTLSSYLMSLKLQTLDGPSAYILSNLRMTEMAVREFEDSPSLDSILPFLQLKSIRQVALPNSIANGGCDEHMNDEDTKDPTLHLTHLSFLPESDIDSRSLAKFLRSFHGLIYFSCVHWNEEELYPFIPPEIQRGLLHSKDSLRELTLVDGGEEYEQADEYEEGTSIHTPENKPVLPPGSLLEFRQLRRLDVTAVALVGGDNTLMRKILVSSLLRMNRR
jgi:hypothetical protein